MRTVRIASLSLLLTAALAPAADKPSSHPVVPGFERFYTSDKADQAQGGQLLLGELNCISCHAATDAAVNRKQAPVLDDVAARVRVAHLRKFIADPSGTKPGTTMPDLFANDPDREAKVEALVQFLASTGGIQHAPIDSKGIGAGRDLYSKIGCVACHGTRDGQGNPDKVLPTSVPLGDLKTKYTVPSLAAFLADPRHARPSGRMPLLVNNKDNNKEGRDIASYLLQGAKVKGGTLAKGSTKYSYYEGAWEKLPDFEKLKPKATGTAGAFDLGAARRESDYALVFEGVFEVKQEGSFKFVLNSDDGSRLYVDDKPVVNNDGIHAPQQANGSIKLSKGVHAVKVAFFQGGGGAELSVQVSGPGLGGQDMAGLVAATEADLKKPVDKPKEKDEDDIEIKADLVAKGKTLFTSAGCASCHSLKDGGKALASTLAAPALEKMKPEGGCLAAEAAKGLPRYRLNKQQVVALTAAVKAPPAAPKEPAKVIARTMTTFNCYACHSRDKVGGPEEAINVTFQTNQPEMGDEARIPPPLDGVGAKMQADYLKMILEKGADDRPYMHTRMPGFGLDNLNKFHEQVAAIDKLPAAPTIDFGDNLAKAKAAGRHLTGGQALGCIKCHTFKGVPAEGTQGIDMTLMTKRLTREWFHAYVLDPQKIRPGTRMPTGWPEGQSVLPKVLDGKAATQIEGIWLFLADGTNAQIPFGMGKHSIPLDPEKEAIIYRNFIKGAGARAIGVGYPEKVNLAFDANEMRLAMIWQGAFIDAGRHWNDRGVGEEPPLGDNVRSLPGGAPLAVLAKSDATWPAGNPKDQGFKFLGYKTTPDERPTFRYSFNDVTVEDFPNAVAEGKDVVIRRTLTFTAEKPLENLYYRAAVGSKIEALEGGWYRIDGKDGLKMKLSVGGQIRDAGGKKELVVPIRFEKGKATLTQEYQW